MSDNHEDHEYNVLRDTPLRLLGYTNEVGESFRHFLGHSGVVMTYVVSTIYCITDATLLAKKAYEKNEHKSSTAKNVIAANTFVQNALWQLTASVIVPGFVINRIVKIAQGAMSGSALSPVVKKWLPTLVGLGSIPMIIKPIDYGADQFFEMVYEPAAHSLLKKYTEDDQHLD
eukprot:TRINITY_DN11677_c0_g1_i1.p1 TRINITY_DN11677_c0_g1~~TRINITY_DN11677_c0_g1_i1.p1  ORF type:complete len:173 (+),score=32.60 TRINITY_DN11677_c0_g1_i1:117-635(+)